jgi:hypothetical protein
MALLSGEVGRQPTSGIRLQRLAVLAAVDQAVSRDTLKFMQGQEQLSPGSHRAANTAIMTLLIILMRKDSTVGII